MVFPNFIVNLSHTKRWHECKIFFNFFSMHISHRLKNYESVPCRWDACTNADENLIKSMSHIMLNWSSQTEETQAYISFVKKYGMMLCIAYQIPIHCEDVVVLKPKVEYVNCSTFVWTDICFGKHCENKKKSFVAYLRIRVECHSDFTKIGFVYHSFNPDANL